MRLCACERGFFFRLPVELVRGATVAFADDGRDGAIGLEAVAVVDAFVVVLVFVAFFTGALAGVRALIDRFDASCDGRGGRFSLPCTCIEVNGLTNCWR